MSTDAKINIASSICRTEWRPLLMDGLLVETFRVLFSNPEAIRNPLLRNKLWSEDATETGIYIEEATVWKPEISGKRPAIIVRQNDLTPQKRMINNQEGITDEGFAQHTQILVGSHTLFCVAKEGAEAKELAAEVFFYLMFVAPLIRKMGNLLKFELVHQGAPGKIKEATDRYGVPITVAYGWQHTWVAMSHAPKLQRLMWSYIFPGL